MALQLIEASFMGQSQIIALDGGPYRTLIRGLVETQIIGGRTHDAVIAECALRERDVTLLTFNENDFSTFTGRGLAIVVPGR